MVNKGVTTASAYAVAGGTYRVWEEEESQPWKGVQPEVTLGTL